MQKIPLVLTTALVPLLLKQLDSLIVLAASISAKTAGLVSSKKIKCNDPRVNEVKKNLENLAKQIAAINKALKGLSKVLSALKKIGNVARILKLVGLIIPTTVPGPVNVIITKFSDTGINCLSAVDSLANLIGYIQIELQKVSVIAANALNVIGSICNDEYFNTDTNTKKQMSSLANLNLGNKVKLSSVNANITGNSAGIGISGTGDPNNGFGGINLNGNGNGVGTGGNIGSGINFNSLLYKGSWDALNNSPFLQSSVGTEGDYYIVSTAGSTTLDGINIWNIDDLAIFSNGSWNRIDSRGFDTSKLNSKLTDNGSKFKHDSRGIYVTDDNSNRTYVSEFYNEYNVSDSDINNALTILNDLYEQQKIEIGKILSDQDNLSLKDRWLNSNNIIRRNNPGTPEQRSLLLYREFPSDVYFGKSVTDSVNSILKPSLSGTAGDIFTGGKPDDFFIDTENKLIYGPKESNTSWGEPIKY